MSSFMDYGQIDITVQLPRGEVKRISYRLDYMQMDELERPRGPTPDPMADPLSYSEWRRREERREHLADAISSQIAHAMLEGLAQ
jgi:hypothetical protein